ncbi:MAG TPA: hypothetical protein VKS43_00370 [Burkholderiales bacterium]|nr:hypothetical protein [Burkholderiales bacterium]
MYENRTRPPISHAAFIVRVVRNAAVAFALTLLSLAIGMAGYRFLENLSWMDAFLNSAMLLGGMGPVNNPVTPAGKLFAGCYALYAGLVFLIVAGLLLVPLLHRILHLFHWEGKEK